MLFVLLVFLHLYTVTPLSCDLSGSDWLIEGLVSANQLQDVLPILHKQFHDEVKNTSTIKLTGSVPGYVLVDLHKSGFISDPLHGNNDVLLRPLSLLTWTYSKVVECPGLSLYPRAALHFEGIDTFGDVIINKKSTPYLGYYNQFVPRWELLDGGDRFYLEVVIRSAVTEAEKRAKSYPSPVPPIQFPEVQHGEKYRNLVRKSPASFSWDWGPAFMAQGIWKPVTVFGNQTYVPESASRNDPIKRISIRKCNNSTSWCVLQLVHCFCLDLECSEEISNINVVLANSTNVIPVKTSVKKGISAQQLHLNITSVVPTSLVNLWNPRGHGNASTYTINTTFTTPSKIYSYSSLVGFRTVQLLQRPLSCPNPDKTCKSFEIMVNDKVIYVKGANLVPSSPFEVDTGLCEGSRLDKLLALSENAGINTLRVWGGGIYLPSCFYKEASRRGIMIWQEFMFACSMYPTDTAFLNNVREEVSIQAEHLSRYPSLIIFGGNNENKQALQDDWYGTSANYTSYVSQYQSLYRDVIRDTIRDIIDVPFLMSSPSNGESGETWVNDNPNSALSGDVHFYNYQPDCMSIGGKIFPVTRFASEFGYQSYPSIRTMRRALGVHEVVLADKNTEHRQHLVMGNGLLYAQINFMFGKRELSDLRNENLSYLSQLYQAICMTAEISHYRRFYRTLTAERQGWNSGVMYWQLNDIWAAPSWASIDSDMNPKMLYYAVQDLYQPVLSVSVWNGSDILVYGINEMELSVAFDLDIFLISPLEKNITGEWAKSGMLKGQSVSLIYILSDDETIQHCPDLDNCVVAVEFKSSTSGNKITNMVVPAFSWGGVQVKNPHLKPQILQKHLKEGKVVLKIVAFEFALWVYLEADRPGIFSHNLFSMYGLPERIIEFSLLEPAPEGEDCCNFTVTSYYHHSIKHKRHQDFLIRF